jgi:hypothetical protein
MLRRAVTAVLVVAIGLPSATLLAPTQGGAGAPPTSPGYWLVGGDGGVFAFHAPFHGASTPSAPVGSSCGFPPPSLYDYQHVFCTAIAAAPSGSGYWLLDVWDPVAFPFGQVGPPPASGTDCTILNQPGYQAESDWAGLASSPSGAGYVLASRLGLVMGCGDVTSFPGGQTTFRFDAPTVGVSATPDGRGCWLVGADGGVFALGDAAFAGSMGGETLNQPVVGIAATPDGKGYWLVASDGGVFSFGDAPYEGSMGGTHLNQPIVGIAGTPDGKGYWLAAADGGVFSFGSAPFEGSLAGKALADPITGIAPYRGPAVG